MDAKIKIFNLIYFSLFVLSCDSLKNLETKVPDRIKGKGMYAIRIKTISFSDKDFGRGLMGNPMPVDLYFIENGNIVWEYAIGQKRGLNSINKSKIIAYNPNAKYRVGLREEGLISPEVGYSIEYPKGTWPFDKGKMEFGRTKSSWIYLDSFWIPSMPYDSSHNSKDVY